MSEVAKLPWFFKLPNGREARYHTEASAIIANVVDPYLLWHGSRDKIAFEVEDALREKGLLR